MAKLRAVPRVGPRAKRVQTFPDDGLPAALVVSLLDELGFQMRSKTTVYPDLKPATIATYRKHTPQARITVTLFVVNEDACKVTVTHAKCRDASALWKILKAV